jgi:hypothetical protein
VKALRYFLTKYVDISDIIWGRTNIKTVFCKIDCDESNVGNFKSQSAVLARNISNLGTFRIKPRFSKIRLCGKQTEDVVKNSCF